jgi:hypothetical protein
VLLLALLGALVAATAILAAARELQAARRLARWLAHAAAAVPRLGADAFVIESDEPQAFCAGLVRARVYITTAALERLDEPALAAVLEHERHHAHRRDPLRLAAGRVLARSLFFVPWLRELTERERAFAELSADETAAIDGGRPALARAMLAFEPSGGIDPARVDRLLGECDPPAWRFPTALFIAGLAASALLAAVAALAARFASGTATLAPPFLSSRPCVTMLAIILAAVAFLGLRAAVRMRAGWLTVSSRDSFRAWRSGG